MDKKKVTNLQDFKEGFKDMTVDEMVSVEEIILKFLHLVRNTPTDVLYLREVLSRYDVTFEDVDDLIIFIRDVCKIAIVTEDNKVQMPLPILKEALEELLEEGEREGYLLNPDFQEEIQVLKDMIDEWS